jgi:nitrogen fixation protein NifU and related proteins
MTTTSLGINQKIMEHFTNPRNIGEIDNADAVAVIGDPSCGDHIKIWIRVKNDMLIDFKYKVFGCWGAISTTSVVSELAIGRSLKQASKLSDDDVIKELGGIPEAKQHCSLLGIQGLRVAIVEFLIKDNHKKYSKRIELYCSRGYDIPELREKMVKQFNGLNLDANILDVGTGKGHLALAIAKSGWKCTSIDISPEEIYLARLNAFYFKVDELIDFKQQDACRMNFETGSFDVVLSACLMHHLSKPKLVLKEMLRVCKPGGRIIISDLNEKGKRILAQVQKEEGKKHEVIGWPLVKVQQWFESNGNKVFSYHEDCEDVLIITKDVKGDSL